MTKTKFHSSVIFVSDIEKSKDFYINILDMEIIHDFGKNVILNDGLTLWELRDNHMIKSNLNTNKSSNKFELYFENEEIDKVYSKLMKLNIEFLHEIHEEPWGQRTLRFFDPDKHLIEIGEPLHTFVDNMHKSGLSNEEISIKSGIPLETVSELLEAK